jgi:MFS family permease
LLGLAVLAWKYHDPHHATADDPSRKNGRFGNFVSEKLDLPGLVLLAIACTATLTLVSRVGPDAGSAALSIGLLIIAVGSTALFIHVERGATNPIMPPSLMLNRAIGPSLLGSCLMGVGFLSLDTYVPLYVQGAKGGGATAAASVVTPVILTWAISGLFAAPLVVRWGFRKTALLGTCLISLSFLSLLMCAFFDAPRSLITGVLLITGLGLGPCSMSYLLGAQNAVTWQQRGSVTSSVQFFRTIGGAVGIGTLGMLFNVMIKPEMNQLHAAGLNPAALMDPRSRATLAPDLLARGSASIGHALTYVFAGMLAAALIQLVVTLFLPRQKPDHPVSSAETMEAMAG